MEKASLRNLRLQDLAPFAALGEVARRLRLELTLFGGTASRAAMHLTWRPGEPLDIFDLAPFSSDIDLEHSGSSKRTGDVLAAIQAAVPFASWFRWSVIDREKAAKARASRQASTQVPLRQIRFSTRRDAEIPDRALDDLATRQVSLARHPAYAESVNARERRDIELHGLMMALNVAAELAEIAGKGRLADPEAALAWLDGAGDELLAAAQSPKLSARFWSLLASQLARLGPDDPIVARLIALAGESGVLEGLKLDAASLGAVGEAFSVSKFTSGGGFRIAQLAPRIYAGPDAAHVFEATLRDIRGAMGLTSEGLDLSAEALIDPALELVAIVPQMTVRPYSAAAKNDDHDVFQSGMEQEFVEIAWRHDAGPPLNPQGLTAQVVPWGFEGLTAASALPAVGGVFGADRAWVRARLDDLVDRAEKGKDGLATLVILQARHGQA
jgi:hypothetical protein